ncbi:MarR family winged helix-turn-helix transcriptional regulator [Lapillicoccus sp.]|uniref:MarR family winged helix-turn-helix transcriptional regulator n=1 Tax=Lapillicoccus sp. TaxID=1909287 RepID=UPI0039831FE9
MLKQVSRQLAADGLRASHFRLLTEIPPSGTRITELSERLGMTKQACGQFVRRLDVTGHVRVEVPADDRRSRVVVRTQLGDHAAQMFATRVGDIEAEWVSRVGPRRYAAFRSVLTELATLDARHEQ